MPQRFQVHFSLKHHRRHVFIELIAMTAVDVGLRIDRNKLTKRL